jgi:acyl-coenzyme A synthetase/AMP-(fatty) acid ligase
MNSLWEALGAADADGTDAAIVHAERSYGRRDLLREAATLADRIGPHTDAHRIVVLRLERAADVVVGTLAAQRLQAPVLYADPDGRTPIDGVVLRPGAIPGSGSASDGIDVAPEPGGLTFGHAGLAGDAQIFLTSGSTGTPTGVVRPWRAMLVDAARVGDVLGLGPDRPLVVTAPLFHDYGYNYGLLAPLLRGAPIWQAPTRSLPSRTARLLESSRAATLIAPPTAYGLLGNMKAVPAGFGHLRAAVSAGGPLSPAALSLATGDRPLPLHTCYGSSEAGAVTLSPVTSDRPGDIGVCLPGVRTRLEEPGDDGACELLLRTESLAAGHLTAEGVEPLPSRDGWFPTGDLVRARGDRLELAGRLATFINVSGKRIDPERVRTAVERHPGVRETHVQGEPDPARGEVPVAYVVLEPGAEGAADVLVWCRQHLDEHELPRSIVPVASLPRSPMGKVLPVPRGRS